MKSKAVGEYLQGFEKLVVWQKARELVSFVYTVSKEFPGEEKFGLTNQVRRAAVSVTANIAEGAGRVSAKEQANFSQMSYSSLMEVLSHSYIANDLGYLREESLTELKSRVQEVAVLLNSLRLSQISRIKPKTS